MTSHLSAKCIDDYTALRVAQFAASQEYSIDSRLESVVDRMLQRCFDTDELKQVRLMIYVLAY